MPKDLVDSTAVFPVPVSVPKDGELATGAAFETPYQQLANRTAYLRQKVEVIGVDRIHRAGSFAGLKAVSGMAPLDLRVVDDFGIYWYDPSSTLGEALPHLVRPSVGSGLWRHLEYGYRSVAGRAFYASPSALTSTSTAWIDVPGISVLLPAARINDHVLITCHGNFNSIITSGFFRLVVNEATVDVPILEAQEGFAPTGGPFHRCWSVLYTTSAGGDITPKLQWKANPGGQVQLFMPVSLTAQLLRP